jgi:outer membrane lipoprotein LolB
MRLTRMLTLAVLLPLSFSACRTLPTGTSLPWPERRLALQTLEHYGFNGRLAAATATEGFSAALDWQQQGVASNAQLRAPLGQGSAQLIFDGSQLQWTARNGTPVAGVAAREAMISLLGFEPPLDSLRYWLLGVPDPRVPGEEALDAAQRLAQLSQGGWQINYGDYVQQGAHWLPGLITFRHGDARLKVHIRHWQLP